MIEKQGTLIYLKSLLLHRYLAEVNFKFYFHMTMDFIGTLHALLTNYIESQINFHHLLVLTFLIVAIITLFIDVMRSDIDCRSTEEDELPGK